MVVMVVMCVCMCVYVFVCACVCKRGGVDEGDWRQHRWTVFVDLFVSLTYFN